MLGARHKGAHPCPDCQTQEADGNDRFGFLMPCSDCMLKRLERAVWADLMEPLRTRPLRMGRLTKLLSKAAPSLGGPSC